MISPTGQGTPLPDFLKCEGEWVVADYIFLFVDEPQKPTARLAVGAVVAGMSCIGFGMSQLAAELGVDSDFLRAANRDQSLIYLGSANIAPTRGGVSAIAYGFRIGERQGYLSIEQYEREGTA